MSFGLSERTTGFTRPCSECENLREKVAYLESELGLADEATLSADFHQMRGLTQIQVRILMALYRAHGRILSVSQLIDLTGLDTMRIELMRVHIFNLRRRVGKDVIANSWSLGYRITPQGMAVVESMRANQPLIMAAEG